MKIRVLGCHGGSLPGYYPVSFVINETLALDAGSLTTFLSLKEQKKLQAILITHVHLDHIRDLPFLADNLFFAQQNTPLQIIAAPGTLSVIQKHFLNGILWPNPFRTLGGRKAIYKKRPISRSLQVSQFKIEAIAVNHIPHARGYVIQDREGAVIFSGDTGPTKELWKKANKIGNLNGIFLELTFPRRHKKLALKSFHLTTESIMTEVSKLKKKVPLFFYHLKPWFYNEILRELKQLSLDQGYIVKPNEVIHLSSMKAGHK